MQLWNLFRHVCQALVLQVECFPLFSGVSDLEYETLPVVCFKHKVAVVFAWKRACLTKHTVYSESYQFGIVFCKAGWRVVNT
jgi:hypothetical protein